MLDWARRRADLSGMCRGRVEATLLQREPTGGPRCLWSAPRGQLQTRRDRNLSAGDEPERPRLSDERARGPGRAEAGCLLVERGEAVEDLGDEVSGGRLHPGAELWKV